MPTPGTGAFVVATPDEIERKAHEMHLERANREAAAHKQGIVPWADLGESLKLSIRRMAQDELEKPQ